MTRHAPASLCAALALAALAVLCACSSDRARVADTTPTVETTALAASPSPASLSDEARAYLDQGLDYIQQNALYRDHVDWPAVREEALQIAAGARVPADTYPAIRYALRQLGDRHSFLMDPAQTQQSNQGAGTGTPEGRRLPGALGYLTLPQAVGPAPGYAETVQRLIREIDVEPVCGWVVDLRTNTGGNMWPMLAGVAPILGEGEVGAFDNGRGGRFAWSVRAGASFSGGVLQAQAPDSYTLSRPHPPVAVLTSIRTASSGEAVAIAFRGRPETRSFGGGTAGVPTANAGKRLSDGATILLTVSRMADRTGKAYEASIAPDVSFPVAEIQTDAPLDAAVAWLRAQPACA